MARIIKICKLSDRAIIPKRASEGAAGFDLYTPYEIDLPPMSRSTVKTDLAIELPVGSYGRIAPTSGLTVKKFIDVGAGVIDRDYRGNVTVVLFNFSNQTVRLNAGTKIAQLICERIFIPYLEMFSSVEELSKSTRGANGFGSTD